jgi:hypothetical protein
LKSSSQGLCRDKESGIAFNNKVNLILKGQKLKPKRLKARLETRLINKYLLNIYITWTKTQKHICKNSKIKKKNCMLDFWIFTLIFTVLPSSAWMGSCNIKSTIFYVTSLNIADTDYNLILREVITYHIILNSISFKLGKWSILYQVSFLPTLRHS